MHSYADDRGFSLMSIFDHLAELPGQFNASTMYAGAVKAWHRHAKQDDYWTVLRGDLKIGLFNSEDAPLSATLRLAGPRPAQDAPQTITLEPSSGRAIHLGEHRPGVLHIPAGIWHGGVAVGGRDALLLYYVTRKYDPAQPDEERAAWDAFSFHWGVEYK
jgi:dTDP-4-dehydrorhamnose 3,5-epimerase